MKIKYLFLAAAMAVAGLTSCSSGDKELDTPKYAAVSARYDIKASGSSIQSVELTESGDYILITSSGTPKAPAKARIIPLAPWQTRADWYANIIQGKFTQVSDTEFVLEGWGRIVITPTSEGYNITFTPNGGESFNHPATKHATTAGGKNTALICRTWSIASIGVKISILKETFKGEYKMNEMAKLRSDLEAWSKKLASKYGYDDDDDDYDDDEGFFDEGDLNINDATTPQKMIFSKSGTYMVTYKGGTTAVATWAWENEDKGVLRYSWNYGTMYGDGSGLVTIDQRGEQLSITESRSGSYDDDDDLPVSFTLTYYLDEVTY